MIYDVFRRTIMTRDTRDGLVVLFDHSNHAICWSDKLRSKRTPYGLPIGI